jgi:hypothetical protein
MPLLPVKHLRGDVVRCTTDCTFSFPLKLELRGQAKIANLDLHLLIDKDIPDFQIPMDDTMGM